MDEYRLYDPKKDYIFKTLFGREKNKNLLISLLNSILRGNPVIKDLTLHNTELTKILERDKSSRLDILAVSDKGVRFDIEMQCRNTLDIPNRALHYSSKLFSTDIKENEDYNQSRVISIWIFGQNVTNRVEAINEAMMTWQMNEHDPYEVMTNHLRIIYLELDKYKVNDSNIRDILSGWVDFLKNPTHIDKRVLDNKDIEEAVKELEYISTDDEERAIIEAIRSGINDQNSRETIARKQGLEEGLKQGKEEGLKQGKEEGLKQGKEEGKKEKAKEMARNMLKERLDINLIAKISGLTIEEIKEL